MASASPTASWLRSRKLRLSDITPEAIRQTYERCARKSARRATYAMQVLRAVLRWHGVVIADNPLGKDTAGRDRIVLAPPKGDPTPIPPERLGAWWNAARKASSRIAGDYYRFQLLTGCRGVEIHGHKKLGYPPLRVADVDLAGRPGHLARYEEPVGPPDLVVASGAGDRPRALRGQGA